MVCLDVGETCLVFANGTTVLKLDVESSQSSVLKVPSFKAPKEKDEEHDQKEGLIECGIKILSVCLSPCGQWLASVDSQKQLCIWDVRKNQLVCNRSTPRGISKVIFTPQSSNIFAGSKLGELYRFSMADLQQEPKLLLGHLAMLLDLCVTPDEKFIVTCDRDEKIRVSEYARPFNIQTFCLGHKDYVLFVSILPHAQRILVSGSGDGTIRLWDYVDGQCLALVDCAKDAAVWEDSIKVKTELATGETANEDGNPRSVTQLCVLLKSDEESCVITQVERCQGIQIYSAKGDTEPTLNLLKVIPVCATVILIKAKLPDTIFILTKKKADVLMKNGKEQEEKSKGKTRDTKTQRKRASTEEYVQSEPDEVVPVSEISFGAFRLTQDETVMSNNDSALGEKWVLLLNQLNESIKTSFKEIVIESNSTATLRKKYYDNVTPFLEKIKSVTEPKASSCGESSHKRQKT